MARHWLPTDLEFEPAVYHLTTNALTLGKANCKWQSGIFVYFWNEMQGRATVFMIFFFRHDFEFSLHCNAVYGKERIFKYFDYLQLLKPLLPKGRRA